MVAQQVIIDFVGVIVMVALAAADSAVLRVDWMLEIKECPTSNLRSWILVGATLRYGLWLAGNKPETVVSRILVELVVTGWGFYEVYFGFCASMIGSHILVYVTVLTWIYAACFATAIVCVLFMCSVPLYRYLHLCCCPTPAQRLTLDAMAAV